MSLHMICDQCNNVIEGENYIQVVVTELGVNDDGLSIVVTPAVTYDYHIDHAPVFVTE